MSDEFPDISQDVRDNYDQLLAERGWSPEVAAAQFDTRDPRLAAYLRSKAAGADQETRKAAPKGRTGTAKGQVTAAASGDTAPAPADPDAPGSGETPPDPANPNPAA